MRVLTVWLDRKSAAARIGKDPRTIRRWIAAGELKETLGRVRESDLIRVEKRMRERMHAGRPKAETTGEQMTATHTAVAVEVLSLSECAAEDCDHEGGCPTHTQDVCLECNTERQGNSDPGEWEGAIAPCPVLGPEPTGPRVRCFCGGEHITGSCLVDTTGES